MSETDINSAQELEQKRLELESYLEDAQIASPKFMAFWDLLDKDFAGLDVNRFREYEELRNRALTRTELVDNRIQTRRSEVPGYDEAHRKLENLLMDLDTALGMHKEGESASDKSLLDKSTQEKRHEYLYKLRESIAQKPFITNTSR